MSGNPRTGLIFDGPSFPTEFSTPQRELGGDLLRGKSAVRLFLLTGEVYEQEWVSRRWPSLERQAREGSR